MKRPDDRANWYTPRLHLAHEHYDRAKLRRESDRGRILVFSFFVFMSILAWTLDFRDEIRLGLSGQVLSWLVFVFGLVGLVAIIQHKKSK